MFFFMEDESFFRNLLWVARCCQTDRRLPEQLVAGFRATLEEVVEVPFQGVDHQGMISSFSNPAVDMVDIPLCKQGFSTIPGGCFGFLNHQDYFVPVDIVKY